MTTLTTRAVILCASGCLAAALLAAGWLLHCAACRR